MTDHAPQNPLTRRLFLVSPRESLLARLSVSQDHCLAEIVGIISPKLRFETWFEGWRKSWRSKAKREFLQWFLKAWGSNFAPDFLPFTSLERLAADDASDAIFDEWWTIQETDELIEIDDSWRPTIDLSRTNGGSSMDRASDYENMVRQTADLRHKPSWHNVRSLLSQTGYSIDRIVLYALDGAAYEMIARLALPNGEIANVTFERDATGSHAWSSIVDWEILPVEDDEDDMARCAATNPELAEIFNRSVTAHHQARSAREEFFRLYVQT